jgi:hypothetical protein
VPQGDSDALAEAFRHLATSPVEREELGARARERAARHFPVERMVEETRQLYDEILAEHHAARPTESWFSQPARLRCAKRAECRSNGAGRVPRAESDQKRYGSGVCQGPNGMNEILGRSYREIETGEHGVPVTT